MNLQEVMYVDIYEKKTSAKNHDETASSLPKQYLSNY